MEPHWHCKICNEGDYDICHECHERGKKCKDETHVLVKKDRYLKAID
jgi:next-to-BRCA1 protein 1